MVELATTPALNQMKDAESLVSKPKAEVQDLNFYYGAFQALKNINMPIADKRVTALIARIKVMHAIKTAQES